MQLPAALVPAAAAAVIAPNLPTAAAAAATAPIVVVIAAVIDGEEEPVPGIDGAGALLVTAGQLLVTAGQLLGWPGGGESVRLLGSTPSVQALPLLPHKQITLKLVTKIR
jgi:hypothetical protein